MNVKTTMTMIIAMVAMISLTGLASAMDTSVQYTGDGSYECNYDAYGTGSIGIHTYTGDGSDHLTSGWTNTEANGWQEMNTYSGTTYNTDYSGTVITRLATVGGADEHEDEAGYIRTLTADGNGNSVYTYANYHDNVGAGSHVTTTQTVAVGSLVDILGSQYTVTGVAAVTDIDGYAYGIDTTISGLVRVQTGDEYTYAYLQMDNGGMNLYTLSVAGGVDPAYDVPGWIPVVGDLTIDGACGQWVEVYAEGIGTFRLYAETDITGMDVDMFEGNDNYTHFDETGSDEAVVMTTTFDGDFEAYGYVYAVDLTAP